jgi:CelD/BcsL family acetyltransferase involved in cellulose biosynthesis
MPPLACDLLRPDELSPADEARWNDLRTTSPALESPFFSPAYARIVGAARPECRVAVLSADGRPAAYLPFHPGAGGVGRPLGRGLSDRQGPIADPAGDLDPSALVRAAGLRAYVFDHLVDEHVAFRPFFRAVEASPVIDLREGFAGWKASVPGRAPSRIAYDRRRMGRDYDLRFTLDDRDPEALRALLRWKSAHFRLSGMVDIVSEPWAREIFERAHATQTPDFAGVLSTLRVGDRVIAANLGLRSGSFRQDWMTSYDREFARRGPGSILLLALIEGFAEDGVTTIDLGKGGEEYKRRFANAESHVGVGAVAVGAARPLLAGRRLAWPVYKRLRVLVQRNAAAPAPTA